MGIFQDFLMSGFESGVTAFFNHLQGSTILFLYMECKFCVSQSARVDRVNFQIQELPRSGRSKHFGLIVMLLRMERMRMVEHIDHKWIQWRRASGVLINGRISVK